MEDEKKHEHELESEYEPCPDCNGNGYTKFSNYCNTCGDTGEI